jgi:hypothetical protein
MVREGVEASSCNPSSHLSLPVGSAPTEATGHAASCLLSTSACCGLIPRSVIGLTDRSIQCSPSVSNTRMSTKPAADPTIRPGIWLAGTRPVGCRDQQTALPSRYSIGFPYQVITCHKHGPGHTFGEEPAGMRSHAEARCLSTLRSWNIVRIPSLNFPEQPFYAPPEVMAVRPRVLVLMLRELRIQAFAHNSNAKPFQGHARRLLASTRDSRPSHAPPQVPGKVVTTPGSSGVTICLQSRGRYVAISRPDSVRRDEVRLLDPSQSNEPPGRVA